MKKHDISRNLVNFLAPLQLHFVSRFFGGRRPRVPKHESDRLVDGGGIDRSPTLKSLYALQLWRAGWELCDYLTT